MADLAHAIEAGALESDVCHADWQWSAALRALDHLINSRPTNPEFRVRRGIVHAGLGQWEKALTDYTKALELNRHLATAWRGWAESYTKVLGHSPVPAEFAGLLKGEWISDDNAALLRLSGKDIQEYHKLCADILESQGKTMDAREANNIAWICALGPQDAAVAEKSVALVSKSVAEKPKKYNYRNTLGALLYRAGQFDAALSELQESIRLQGDSGGTPYDWLFLAMVHQRQGRTDEAQQWLQKAIRWIDAATNAKPDVRGGAAPTESAGLDLLMLRREAEELLGGPAVKPKE
jgi:tetratricopeptide (TPR) repeat protein